MASNAAESADGSARSTGAAGVDGNTGLGCATVEPAGNVATASSSVLRVSWERKGEDMAPMESEGSIRAKLDSGKTGVREKTPEILTSSKPAGSKEEVLATLGCASAGAGVASCASTLMIFRSIRH